MGALCILLIFALVLFILSEPLYITVKKQFGTEVVFHFVFFSLSFTRQRRSATQEDNPKKKTAISPLTYLKSWLKLRKRVKIKLDALYLPLPTTPHIQALLSALCRPYRRGFDFFENEDDTSFLLHIETTPLDAIVFYLKCIRYEKLQNER